MTAGGLTPPCDIAGVELYADELAPPGEEAWIVVVDDAFDINVANPVIAALIDSASTLYLMAPVPDGDGAVDRLRLAEQILDQRDRPGLQMLVETERPDAWRDAWLDAGETRQ